MFFTVLYSRYTVPPVIDRTILFPYKCCVFLKVLGSAKFSVNELPLTGANVLSMISGYTPWWILVHPESADFQVGYFPNLEVWIPIFKKEQTLKTLEKLCKCWHPEVKVVLFFVCFFFMFLSRLGVRNCQGEVGEIRRRWQDWRDLYWGCSEGQEGPVLGVTSGWRLYPFSWEIISLILSPDRRTKSSWGIGNFGWVKVSPKWSADVFLGKLEVDV